MKFYGGRENAAHCKRSKKTPIWKNPSVMLVVIAVGALLTALNFRTIFVNSISNVATRAAIQAAEMHEPDNVTVVVTRQPDYMSGEMFILRFPYVAQTLIDTQMVPYTLGHTSTAVNVRKGPSTEEDIICVYPKNTLVEYIDYNDEWCKINMNGDIAYIYSIYIEPGEVQYRSIFVESSGFKSFMGYKAITAKSSSQYKIQHNYAYTGQYGIRQVNDRFCIALGSAVNAKMGTYVDLVLANGTVIPCILSDQKDDRHTLDDNLTTAVNGCVSEFIVDKDALVSMAKAMGDVSYVNDEWRSPVVEIRIYEDGIWEA